MKSPLVVAPGSINVDLILKTTSLKGPKTFHGDYAESQGGKGSNQAIAARRAGTDDSDVISMFSTHPKNIAEPARPDKA